jgi:hypothetical protein
MSTPGKSRRQFLKAIGLGWGAMELWHKNALIEGAFARRENRSTHSRDEARSADYTLHIRRLHASHPHVTHRIAPKRIISATTYNGRRQVTRDVCGVTRRPSPVIR